MIPVVKKLKSKSGISLAIALVFFLLCAMVGTAVLSAASVSAGNTARERQLYRETLAMTSAAQLLRQEIRTMTFQGSRVKTEAVKTVTPSAPGEKTKVTTLDPTWEDGTTEWKGGTFLKDDMRNLFLSNIPDEPASQPVQKSLTMTIQAEPEKGVPDVTGTLTVDEKEYTVTLVLQCGENSMTMTFPAQIDEKTEIETPTPEVNGNTSVKKTVITYTTTVTWGAPTVQEGVDAP